MNKNDYIIPTVSVNFLTSMGILIGEKGKILKVKNMLGSGKTELIKTICNNTSITKSTIEE